MDKAQLVKGWQAKETNKKREKTDRFKTVILIDVTQVKCTLFNRVVIKGELIKGKEVSEAKEFKKWRRKEGWLI